MQFVFRYLLLAQVETVVYWRLNQYNGAFCSQVSIRECFPPKALTDKKEDLVDKICVFLCRIYLVPRIDSQ